MSQRHVNVSVFTVFAIMTVPLAVVLEIGTIDLGHELTWRLFGGVSQLHSAWIRYVTIAVAIASIISALAHRRGRGET